MTDFVEIPLTKGYYAIIDADDYPLVSRHRWRSKIDRHTVYAWTTIRSSDGKKAASGCIV